MRSLKKMENLLEAKAEGKKRPVKKGPGEVSRAL